MSQYIQNIIKGVLMSTVVIIAACKSNNDARDIQKTPLDFATIDTTTTTSCYITTWLSAKEKAMVFTWDDYKSGAGDVADLFNKYGLKTTFYISTDLLDNWKFNFRHPWVKTIFKKILADDHEIGTHSHTHVNLLSIPRNQVEEQLSKSSDAFLKNFGFRPTSMSYPTSHYDKFTDSLVNKYYLDSRYSIQKDSDSTFHWLHVRSSYNFSDVYKKEIDSFIYGNTITMIWGGHQLDNKNRGYEPMPENTLDSVLNYISTKYHDELWVTTYEDMILYSIMRQEVKITNTKSEVLFNTENIDGILEKYTHPHAFITLCFPNAILDFSSEGLESAWYEKGNSYCTIDLRKTKHVRYSSLDSQYKPIGPKRNL